MSTEKFANSASTTLSAAIATTGAISISVTSTTGFPSAAQYRIKIDSEIMIVTAGAGTTTWIVTRGAEGTTAATHSNASAINHIVTKGSLDQRTADETQRGAYTSLPAVEKAGRLYIPSDGNYLGYDDGSNWSIHGPLHPLTKPPLAASLTSMNIPSGTTITDSSAGLVLQATGMGTAENTGGWEKVLPSAPYTITVAFHALFGDTNQFTGAGLFLRASAGGNVLRIFQRRADQLTKDVLNLRKMASPTTSVTDVALVVVKGLGSLTWFQIVDNGTTRFYKVSLDGINWMTFYSEANGVDSFVPDRIGFCVWSVGSGSVSAPILATFASYKEA